MVRTNDWGITMKKRGDWTQIEQLFQSSLERPLGQRRAYIQNAAKSDDLAKATLRLLTAYESSTSFMSTSLNLPTPEPSYKAGDVIGSWQVERIIGTGGMGEVYLVNRTGADFEQTAALKLIRIDDPIYEKRFHKERQLLASLEHAGIGRLIDGGQGPDGRQYMVIEFIAGAPITDYAKEQSLDSGDTLKLFVQLAEAMAYAHRQQILHRDLKPANVLVTQDGAVKLIDFGVAHVLNVDEQSAAPVTIAYAAPEQLQGRPVSVATDIYGLGLLLFELMAKTRFGTDETQEYKNLHRDLRAIIDKCLQPHPQDRFHSAEDLIKDIDSFLARKPVASRDGGIWYRSERFISRHKLLTSLLVMTTITGSALGFMLEADVISFRARFYKTPPIRTIIACNNVAITITGTHVFYKGNPTSQVQSLLGKAQDIQKNGDIIRAFAVTPDCKGGVIVSDRKDVFAYENPDKNWQVFKGAVTKLRAKRSPINAIAFEPWKWEDNKSFVIAHKKGVQASGLIDAELPERILSAVKSTGSLKAIAIRPRPNESSGWSFVGPNGFTYSRNVSHDEPSFFPIIENMKHHGFVTDYITFSPNNVGGFAYAFGSQDCEMSNISTPRDSQRCDYEAITGGPLVGTSVRLEE